MSDDRAPMQADTELANVNDPIVQEILAATAGGAAVAPDAIARRFADRRRKPGDAPDIWRKYLNAVRQQITNLARKGSLEILRKGEVIDPSEMKGLIKVRQPFTTSGN
ncbi:DUF3253 domain-containing protein [Fodinicurvata sp. EGI_FJ10296]|uniref:DUF3253 domain-containing protein n=1 Tax=Fodinicurvata sp. EGI_FJ10296 TaxID=3231908 RepID=UPI00345709EB